MDLQNFLTLSQKKSLTPKETIQKEKLDQHLRQNINFLQDLRDYALLSHAAYLRLNNEGEISQKRLFKALTNHPFHKEKILIAKMQPFLARHLVKKYKLIAHINEKNVDSKMGFRASVFEKISSKELILAIAGSDFRILNFDFRDLWCDILLLCKKFPKKQFEALEKFYKRIESDNTIILVGHSLGGFLAHSFGTKYPHKVKALYTFQAPSICEISKPSYPAFHIHTSHNQNFCPHFLYYNFVQRLYFKSQNELWLNVGSKKHHPNLYALKLYAALKML